MISADEEERRLAFVRQRAMHDEATLLKEAREGGFEQGIEKGRQAQMRETALNLISMNVLTDAQIAQASGLSVPEVMALRDDGKH